jgi:hypothetical protein
MLVATVLALGCTKHNPYWAAASESGTTVESTEAGSDGSVGSTTTGPMRCLDADDDTVAYYPFEQDVATAIVDEANGYDGSWLGDAPTPIPGPDGCGQGVQFASGQAGVIPDVDAFELDAGAVEFWAWFPSDASDSRGILSRDGVGYVDGHLSIYFQPVQLPGGETSDRHVTVRLQTATDEGARCSSAPMPSDRWIHVGLNFGPPGLELFIDGEAQGIDAMAAAGGMVQPCDASPTNGIAGNDSPWVLGATNHSSDPGTTSRVENWFEGAIDELRISSAPRPFGG